MLIKVLLSMLATTLTTSQLLEPARAIPQNNLFTIAAIENVEGWRDTYWGMSYEEVKRKYPFTDEPRDHSGKTNPNRYVGLTKIKIDNRTFRVRFVFEKGIGLDAVSFWWEKSSQEPSNPINFVINDLTTKYGSPDKQSSMPMPGTEFQWSKDMKWVKRNTVIELDACDKYISLIFEKRNLREGF
jgi:hypothetical protein